MTPGTTGYAPTEPADPTGTTSRSQLGSRGLRLIAQVIDGAIVIVPVVLIDAATRSVALAGVLYLLGAVFYAPTLLARVGSQNGQTLGKQALGLRVTLRDQPGAPITFGQACRREILGRQLLNIFTFGLYSLADSAWCLFDREKQTLHDKVADTIVVTAKP